mmetsp:Transcript_67025/g.160641  ORF Transcript_67025/g.160641 Transcript_67025/m.160641 type:complete len:607 (+) Transcript_67025:91-1911(+)
MSQTLANALKRCRGHSAFFLQLACIHVILAQGWFSAGLRKAFTSREHVHYRDLQAAWSVAEKSKPATRSPVKVAEANDSATEEGLEERQGAPEWSLPAPPEVPGGEIAFLFMLRTQLEQLPTWRAWLAKDCCYDGRNGPAPASLYFHFADGKDAVKQEHLDEVLTMPGFRQVVSTVYTGWCELMAAEVAMLAAALKDNAEAKVFVFLPHDAVPLVPLPHLRQVLLSTGDRDSERPPSRLCNSGVRGMDMPHSCAHSIEPHWARMLMLKHHQWMALNRNHAEQLTDVRRLKVASSIFWDSYTSEPLCSDELLPLLALAVPDSCVTDEIAATIAGHSKESSKHISLQDLPLYHQTFKGLDAFDEGLAELNIRSECIMYAPWPGCDETLAKVGQKRARSPIVGGGLSPKERGALMAHLIDRGLLFCRKLGLWGGSPEAHVTFIHEHVPRKVTRGPARVLPEGRASPTPDLFAWIRWQASGLEAYVSKPMQVILAGVVLLLSMWAYGLEDPWTRWFLGIFAAGHVCFFSFSILLTEELSFDAPFVGHEAFAFPAGLVLSVLTLRLLKPPYEIVDVLAEGSFPSVRRLLIPLARRSRSKSSPCRQVFPKDP